MPPSFTILCVLRFRAPRQVSYPYICITNEPIYPCNYRGTSLITKRPPPLDHHRALDINLLQGARVGRFLMSEVPP